MAGPMGILISSFDYSPVAEDEFHDWYDMEHIPERQRIPGFLDCTRWLAFDLPKVSLNTYDLASVDVLREPGYLAVGYENNSPWTRRVGWRCIKRLRFEGMQVAPGDRRPPEQAQGLVVVASNPVDCDAALPSMLDEIRHEVENVSGVSCARRFVATNSTHGHVLTCHLDDTAVVASTAWKAIEASLEVLARKEKLRDLLITHCVRYRRTPT